MMRFLAIAKATGFPSPPSPPSAQERELGLIPAAFPLMHALALLFFVLTTHFVFILEIDKTRCIKLPSLSPPALVLFFFLWLTAKDCSSSGKLISVI